MGVATDNFGGSIIHISLAIYIKNKHKKSSLLSSLWTMQYILIVNEISMVELDILSNILI